MMKPYIKPTINSDFYRIHRNDDGTVDVILCPGPTHGDGCGSVENDIAVRVVKGIEPFDGLEEDIRRRYGDWHDSGENI